MGFSKTHEELARMMYASDARKRKHSGKKRKKSKRINAKQSGSPRFQRIPYTPGMGVEFYATNEWRTLRWKVLANSDGRCVMCGHTAETSGKPLHVDHIEPRSKRPNLELHILNLQVLCEDCNLGKGATYWKNTPIAARNDTVTGTTGPLPSPRLRIIKRNA